MLLTITVLFVGLLIASFLAWDLHRENVSLAHELERSEIKRLSLVNAAVRPIEIPVTAKQIVEDVAPKRIKLRKSASDISALEEIKHNTKAQNHEKIVRNIEAVGLRALKENK